MKLEGGSRQWLIIHRFKCCSCGRLHNELPDCLVPYKHYHTEIISGVLDGVCTPDDLECADYPCADTMLLWLKWFSLNLQRIEGFLRRALYKVSCIKEGFSHDSTSLLETAAFSMPEKSSLTTQFLRTSFPRILFLVYPQRYGTCWQSSVQLPSCPCQKHLSSRYSYPHLL